MTTTGRKAVRVHRTSTPEETVRLKELRRRVELDKAEILSEGRNVRIAKQQATAKLREAFSLLKAERERQGLSLAELAESSGIGKSALSRLENDAAVNPTVTTLERYAEALGKTLVVTFQ